MKRNIIATVLLLCGLTLTSCSKDFLDTAPTDALTRDQLSGSFNGMKALLDGVHNTMYNYDYYDAMGNPQGFGVGYGSFMYKMDYLGDDFINSVPAIYMGLHRYEDHTNPYGEINERAWLFFYSIINQSSTIINSAEASKVSEKEKDYLLGQAYTFRAMSYHFLAQLFGKRYVKGGANDTPAVPLKLDGEKTDPLPRASVKEIYDQIDSDIAKALDHLSRVETQDKNQISYSAACAIAARVALSKQDYAAAEKYAAEGIAKKNGNIKLQTGTDLLDGFNDINATEWIWGYKQASDQDQGYWGYMAHVSCNFKAWQIGGTHFAINRDIYDPMGKNDARRKWFVCADLGDKIPSGVNEELFALGNYAGGQWSSTGQQVKFWSQSSDSSRGDMLILRLSELYYIKAEAEARQGKDAAAQKTLGEIMVTRDPEYNASKYSGEQLISEIMRNKRIDHWGEGLRFFDIKRLGITFDRSTASNVKYLSGAAAEMFRKRNTGDLVRYIPKDVNSPAWEFAIPYDEIKAAGGVIEQNPLVQ